MAPILRASSITTVCTLLAFVCLVLGVVTPPIAKFAYFGKSQSIIYGIFGACDQSLNTCTKASIGYSKTLANEWKTNVTFLSVSARQLLSKFLILHPVAALLTIIIFFISSISHFRSFAHSSKFLLVVIIFLVPTALVCLASFVIEMILFAPTPNVGWVTYLTLVSFVLNLIGLIAIIIGRCRLRKKKAFRRKVDESAMEKEMTNSSSTPGSLPTPPYAPAANPSQRPNNPYQQYYRSQPNNFSKPAVNVSNYSSAQQFDSDYENQNALKPDPSQYNARPGYQANSSNEQALQNPQMPPFFRAVRPPENLRAPKPLYKSTSSDSLGLSPKEKEPSLPWSERESDRKYDGYGYDSDSSDVMYVPYEKRNLVKKKNAAPEKANSEEKYEDAPLFKYYGNFNNNRENSAARDRTNTADNIYDAYLQESKADGQLNPALNHSATAANLNYESKSTTSKYAGASTGALVGSASFPVFKGLEKQDLSALPSKENIAELTNNRQQTSSPAESSSSHFTSISQREINPNWQQANLSSSSIREPPRFDQLNTLPKPKRQQETVIFDPNDFSLPAGRAMHGKTARGNTRFALRGTNPLAASTLPARNGSFPSQFAKQQDSRMPPQNGVLVGHNKRANDRQGLNPAFNSSSQNKSISSNKPGNLNKFT